MNDLRDRRLQAEIAAIAVHAGVVGETLGMAAEIDRVIGLIKTSGAEHEFGLAIAFEAGARHHVEDAVGAIALLGAVAAATDFEIVNVLGIDLRADVGGDVGVGHGHAVDEPAGLVAAANVELVVGDVGAGNVIGDQRDGVGAGGTGQLRDVAAADHRGGSGGISGRLHGDIGDGHAGVGGGHVQLKMRDGNCAGDDGDALSDLFEAGADYCNGVIAERDGGELKFARAVGGGGGSPVGSGGLEHYHRALNGAMLGIVNDAAYRAEDGSVGEGGEQQRGGDAPDRESESSVVHIPNPCDRL